MIPRLSHAFGVLLVLLMAGQSALAQKLDVKLDGDHLRVSVSGSRLIAGEALQRLRDGASITYFMRVSVWSGRAGKLLSSTEYRFVVSFDIFEERFQVTRTMPSARVVSHLSMTAAEIACSDGLEIPLVGIAATMQFWVQWEFQAENAAGGEAGGGLGSLVDLFGRKSSKEPAKGFAESGPYRLADLPRYSAPRR